MQENVTLSAGTNDSLPHQATMSLLATNRHTLLGPVSSFLHAMTQIRSFGKTEALKMTVLDDADKDHLESNETS